MQAETSKYKQSYLETGACTAYLRKCKERSEGKVVETKSKRREGAISETTKSKKSLGTGSYGAGVLRAGTKLVIPKKAITVLIIIIVAPIF